MAAQGALPTMLQTYIVLYRYKAKGEKKPGPVRQFRIYAQDFDEARREANRYANYPDIEIVEIQAA